MAKNDAGPGRSLWVYLSEGSPTATALEAACGPAYSLGYPVNPPCNFSYNSVL